MGAVTLRGRTVPDLAAMLVLAGCSGTVGADGTPTRSVTPAPVPADATPPARATAPGLSPRGVENASLLGASHRRTLADVPFTERTVTTVRDGNAVLGRRTLVVEPEAGLYAGTLERASLRRVDRRVADGTARYVFVAERVTPRPVFGLPGASPTGDATLRAVVGTDGVVHRVTVTFPARYRGRSATVEHVFEYVEAGTTAPRPPWYDEAIENGTPTPGVRAEG